MAEKVEKEKMVFAFRCSRTGLYFPADYVEQWGRKYGDGLGPVPVSEALVNAYDQPIPDTGRVGEAMHPLAVCRAQVDLVQITESEYESKRAIIDKHDPAMTERAALMREKQTLKSNKLAALLPEVHAKARNRANRIAA